MRFLLKKAPKFISYAIWGVVAFRLMNPFSFESLFSLMPKNGSNVLIPHDIMYQQSPQINTGIEVVDSFVSQSLPSPLIGDSVNPLQIYVQIGAYIWILGVIAFLMYTLLSILSLKKQLKTAQWLEKNIYEAKNLKTPFVLGLISPKIYLPIGLSAEEKHYILLHEETHINRYDHIVKMFAVVLLAIHWFNPLMWIAFTLMNRDMELSCDERVLNDMDENIKKTYAHLLLSFATGRNTVKGIPLAFGEGNVKGRIKNVLKYKKPKFWLSVSVAIIATVIGIGLMANPKTDSDSSTAKAIEISSAQELWKARTKYVGDNSAVSRLINLLPLPEGLQFDHFRLHTTERPYVVEIVYSTSFEKLEDYDTEQNRTQNPFEKSALLLLALIDNADQISIVLTDGNRKVDFISSREGADETVGRDIREYAASPEKLQELIDMSP
jgi:beta-lactamase regulating signal transducer with metallopeptidase domain